MTADAAAVREVDEAAVWRLGHRPALDGVRGLALVMVFIGHAGWPWRPNRAHEFGVELFFVLSGFLITSLLIDEHRSQGRVDLRAFYVRRARRLLPALVPLFVFVALVALSTDRFDRGDTAWGVVAGATYSSNFFRVNGVELGPLAHLWSLSVEEHFYLVWPALMAIVAWRFRGRHTVGLAAAVAALGVVMLWRWHLVDIGERLEWQRMYNATDVRIAAPLIGCILAFAMRLGLRRTSAVTADVLGLAGVGVLAWLATGPSIVELPHYWTRALPLAGFVAALVCLAGVAGSVVLTALAVAPLRWLGRLSYGAYLWHYPVFLLVGGELTTMSTLETSTAVVLTLVVAVASARLIEAPFRRAGHAARANPAHGEIPAHR